MSKRHGAQLTIALYVRLEGGQMKRFSILASALLFVTMDAAVGLADPVSTTLPPPTTTTLTPPTTTSTTTSTTSTTLCTAANAPRRAATPSECAADKLTGAGKYLSKAMKCQAKALKKGEEADSKCFGKANRVLNKAFERAEAQLTDCPFLEDVESIEDLVDDLQIEIMANLPTGVLPSAPDKLGGKCAAKKAQAVSRAAVTQLGCAEQAALDGGSIDATCVENSKVRLASTFDRAERRPGCETTGDAAELGDAMTYGVGRIFVGVQTGAVLPPVLCPSSTTTTTTVPSTTTTTVPSTTSTTTTVVTPTTTSTTTTTVPCKCRATLGNAGVVAGDSSVVKALIKNTSTKECEFEWEVTRHNGTPTVNPNPESGTETLAAGAIKRFNITMAVPANTSATDAATMLLSVTSDGTPCTEPGKICVLPSGETSTSSGWANGGIHKWTQTLTPGTANFQGRKVHEKGGKGTDTCWFRGSQIGKFDRITGGAWKVGNGNVWGPDFVGWKAKAVDYYRRIKKNACGTTFPQDMYINCPHPMRAQRYIQGNQLGGTITATTVTSTRAGLSETR